MKNFTKLSCSLKKLVLSAFFLFSFFFSFSQSIATYWQYNRSGPVGYDITDICYVNNTIGYACGAIGVISRTTDAGRTWVHDNIPGKPLFNAIVFPSEKVGYVVSIDGKIAKTSNRGISWALITSPTTAQLNNLYFFDDNNGIIVGNTASGAANIWKTTNGGTSWTSLAAVYPVQNRNLVAISFLDANIGYISGASGHVAKTIDGGVTWTNVSFATGNPVQPTGTTGILTQTYAALTIINAQTVIVGSQNNSFIVKTIDGGATWVCKAAQNGTPSTIAGSQSMFNMVSGGNDVAVAMGPSCGVSHDAGETWTFNRPHPLGTKKTGLGFLGIAMTPDKGIKMAGAYGVMVDSASGAAQWDTSYYKNLVYNPAGLRAILSISALDKNNIVAAGNRGILYRTSDAGKNWTDRTILDFQATIGNPTATEYDIKDVKYVAADALYICVTNGYVYRSFDGGDTWPENVGDPYYFNVPGGIMQGLEFINKNTGWVCGGTGTVGNAFVYRTIDGGLTWTRHTGTFAGATYLYSLEFVNATTGWATGNGGRLYKTTDGGNNWVQQTVPATVTTNLFSAAFANADTGWVVGASRIIYTTDGGTTWTQQLASGNNNKVMAINGKTAVTFANNGICVRTIDGGTTWTDFGPPTSDALFGATYLVPYNSLTSGVNPADVEMLVGGGKAAGSQSPTILHAKVFYAAPVPPAPVIANVADKCPASLTAKGKIMNLPPYTAINITVDGEQVLYSPEDSTFFYYHAGVTTSGSHNIVVTFTNNGGTSNTAVSYSLLSDLTPAVSIASSDADNTVCQGTTVTFTATAVNGGTTPAYQWKVNGTNAGTNSNTFAYIPANNDVVTVVMTPDYSCATAPTATSNTQTFTVIATLTPAVSITSNDADNIICQGSTITFTATPVNGGTAPTYQWRVNGVNVASVSNTFTYTPANNDIVSVVMTSNYTCLTVATATSTGVTIQVPSLQNTITANLNVLTATSPNSATATYQWYLNGQAIPGATSLTYTATGYGTYTIQETFRTCTKQSNQIVLGPNSGDPLVVFPTPADRVLNIKSGSAAMLISKVGIYDVAGRLYISYTNAASNYFQVDVSKLITGLYIIKLETTQGIFEKMFMKK